MARGKKHIRTKKRIEKVKELSMFGISQEIIAKSIGISHDTLTRLYRDELDEGVTEANSAVARSLFLKATVDQDVTAMIFWLKTRAKWKEEKNEVDKSAIKKVDTFLERLGAKNL